MVVRIEVQAQQQGKERGEGEFLHCTALHCTLTDTQTHSNEHATHRFQQYPYPADP